MYISISGNIGSGKTTLTQMLCEKCSWDSAYETVEGNPYLDDFYTNMKRWSFNTQIYFLNKRIQRLEKIQEGQKFTVQDRSIYEDAYIFAKNLFEMNLMPKRDYQNYISLFQFIQKFIIPPNLLIYLKADVHTLQKQIKRRGRKFEDTISKDYLRKLNDKYEQWIKKYSASKVLIIDANEIDFLRNQDDFKFIVNKIKTLLKSS